MDNNQLTSSIHTCSLQTLPARSMLALSGWPSEVERYRNQLAKLLNLDTRQLASPKASRTDFGNYLAIGPHHGWIVGEDRSAAHLNSLQEDLADIALVADMSGAYRWHRLKGASAQDVLMRGAKIDLDAEMFMGDQFALTRLWSIQALIWKRDELTFDLALPASYEQSGLSLLGKAMKLTELSEVH